MTTSMQIFNNLFPIEKLWEEDLSGDHVFSATRNYHDNCCGESFYSAETTQSHRQENFAVACDCQDRANFLTIGENCEVNNSNLSDWLDADKELDMLLSESSSVDTCDLSFLPDKTLLCNDSCDDFLRESSEQLSMATGSMCILGVNLFTGINVETKRHTSIYLNAGSSKYVKEGSWKYPNDDSSKYAKENSWKYVNDDSSKYEYTNVIGAQYINADSSKFLRGMVDDAADPTASNDDDKLFQCQFRGCLKVYAKSSHLKAHARRHNGDKPFLCSWPNCTWRFSRSDELARHSRSHSGIKPYKCEDCPKSFCRSDHLAKHKKVHRRRLMLLAKQDKMNRSGNTKKDKDKRIFGRTA